MEINQMLKISNKQLEIVNNYKLDYKEFGKENKNVMVLVHGFADDYYVYNPVIERFKEQFHIFALRLPTVNNEYIVNKCQLDPLVYAYHVTKFLEDYKLKNIVLIGHSMGGGIVCYVNNLAKPETIKTSILIDPMNSSNGVNILNIFKINPKKMNQLIEILPLIYEDPYNVFGLELVKHELLIDASKRYAQTHKNNQILFNRMASLKNKINLKKAKDNNPIPSLVMFGKNDHLLMWKNAKKSYLKGKNFSFVLINNAGHAPMADQPEKTNSFINDWLVSHYWNKN